MEEHGRLFAGLTLESDVGFDDELNRRLFQTLGKLVPGFPVKHDPEVRDGDLVTIDRIGRGGFVFVSLASLGLGHDVGDDLMTKEIKIHPFFVATAFGAAQELSVEFTCRCQRVNGKSQVKWEHGIHGCRLN